MAGEKAKNDACFGRQREKAGHFPEDFPENFLRCMLPQDSLPWRYLRAPIKRMMVLNWRNPKLSSSA